MAPKLFNSLKQLLAEDKQWLIDYMSNNPGANQIDNYIISVNSLKEGFSCGIGKNCEKLKKDCKDPDNEDLRLFLLCFFCDRIFHQRCSHTSEEDLDNDKTPWICYECTKDPLNSHSTNFFKSKRYNLTLKERLERFTTVVEIPSPKQKTGNPQIIELDSILELSAIEQSLHANFQDLEPSSISRILGTKLVNQQEEFSALKSHLMSSEREKLELTQKLAEKVKENESYAARLENLEKTMNERMFLQDTKLQMLQNTPGVKQTPPCLSSTMVMNHPSHSSKDNPSISGDKSAMSQTLANDDTTKSAKINEISYSIKVLKANDIMQQISRELNQPMSNLQLNSSQPIDSTSNSYANNNQFITLRDIRKTLPKIEKFDGEVDKWLTFERAVDRNRREGQYPDSIAKNLIREALTGQALERIDDLYNHSTADELMSFLKECYGCSNNIVANSRMKLMAVKLSRPLTHTSAMEVTTKIASYMAACKYAQLPVLDMSISIHIHNQLEPPHQQQYYNFYYAKYPGQTRMERLDVQFEFLNDIAKSLPMGIPKSIDKKESPNKSGNYQVYSTSVASTDDETHSESSSPKFHSNPHKEDFKFELRSRDKAPYIGYDMDKVEMIQKKCYICGDLNHFSLECREYRDMSIDQRYNMINSHNLCPNCLITPDHHAKDCDIKLGCGFNMDNFSKCALKHHISLHRGKSKSNNAYKNSKGNFKPNAETSNGIADQNQSYAAPVPQPSAPPLQAIHQQQVNVVQQNPQQQNTSQASQYRGHPAAQCTISQHINKGYVMCSTSNPNRYQSSERTVKLLRTYIYGADKKAVGYAVGDSAAEITLIKRSLMDDLKLTGIPCDIELQWTDAKIKVIPAMKLDLKISGILPNSEILVLNECYAIDDLQIAPRSLNVQQLKEQFPYLRKIPFDSYYNATPCILIGSRHAYAIEAVETMKSGGINNPVALKTKLGYTIYGGALECHQNQSYAIESTTTNKRNEIIQKVSQRGKWNKKSTKHRKQRLKENSIRKFLASFLRIQSQQETL